MIHVVIGLMLFLALQVATSRLFAPRMPERMITHRSIAGSESSLPRRVGLLIGPLGSLVLGVAGLVSLAVGHAVRSPATMLVIQAIFYVVALYMYVLNLRRKRRSS